MPVRPSDAERQIASGLRTGWVALATFLGLIALSAALLLAFEHAATVADDLSRDDERQLVERFLARTMENAVSAQMGLINWDETIAHVDGAALSPRDMDWIDREFGTYAAATYTIDRAFLLRSDGSLVRAWQMGRTGEDAQLPRLRALAAILIAQSRTPGMTLGTTAGQVRLPDGTAWPIDRTGMPLPRWAGGLATIDGRPEIMTVGSVVPDRVAGLFTHAPVYYVTLRPLDAQAMARMRRDLLLPDLGVTLAPGTSARDNTIALHSIDGGHLGWLRWTAKSPGPIIMQRTTPMLWGWALLFACVLIGGSVVLRRSWRITRELLASEAQARHNALHDAMSGLPNRVHYMQRLRQDLAGCIDGSVRGDVFVGYIDLDAFKVINDTLGHHVGDEVVRQVALRLRRLLPAGDFIARFGGDEFVVLRRAEGGRATADMLGRQILAVLRETFVISGHSIDMTCSCGISWGPAQSEDPGELLRRADIALYRAKQRGRARYRCFTRDMDASVKLRLELETELRRAIARDDLSVAYQPIVSIGSGAIVGVEALLRWQHPERGAIRPDLFVPIAEQGGLMIPLGNWILRAAFNECRDWPECDISVNLSPIQIMASDFVATMAAIIAETGMDPSRVVLEVTEGVMLDRSEQVLTTLRDLKHMGFRVALDDFGQGYSSLGYLRLFEFERIKIDRAFVSNIEGDADANAILCAIASLGHSLRMKVVAEGVETETQARLVQSAGCELAQGYLYWKPMPAADMRQLLTVRDPVPALKSA
ncbi:bifunctional diguanylate cyclase/phosphodiesterase [Novosphingobium sp.]|uniref:putative bifunctional diguanylate cyclase/phosphodiesterase n=1 Tax=Novosphingobium sp. TaxID=1874826 RepID=UPI00333E6CBD